jgi:cell division protein FtsB
MNNTTILAVAFLVIAMLSIKLHCTNDELNKQIAEVNALENKNATLEADRMFVLDSVNMLNESLEAERMALTNRLDGYKMKPTKERIKLITLIDTFAIQTDTGAILSMHGVDSINKLTMHYQSCVVQSAIKDTIITHLTTANLQADSMLINKDKILKKHKKAAKIQIIKAAVWSGLVGIIIGLVI